jgi:hypothetical protein
VNVAISNLASSVMQPSASRPPGRLACFCGSIQCLGTASKSPRCFAWDELSKADKDGHDGDDVLKLTAAAEVVAPELTPIILGTAAAVIIYQNQDAISDAISNTVQSTNDGVKKEWEKLWGTTWPKDPATGKNQDCCHIVPKADGGAHNVNNVEPLHIRYGNA